MGKQEGEVDLFWGWDIFNCLQQNIIIRQMRTLSIVLVLVLAVVSLANGYSPPTSPQGFHFIVEAKVVIDGKSYNPTNLSITIGPNVTIPAYTFNLSSANFNKNATIPLRLFAWYNGQWTLSRQSIILKVTDKRNVYRLRSHLLAKLLKFNSRKYQAKMSEDKEIAIFTAPKVIISYDPESSLLVSRMEDPNIFSQQQSYIPISDLTAEMKKQPMSINVSFALLTRSDALITLKNHIVSLNEMAGKVKERIPLISRSLEDSIDPLWILKGILMNFDRIKQSNKQYLERATLMANKKYESLLLPRLHHIPYALPEAAHQLASSYNISLSDNVVPTYYYILQQGFILDTINQVQNYLRQKISDLGQYDSLVFLEAWARIDVMVSFGVAIIWILLDVISYKYKQIYPGLSISFGYFFMAWLIFEQVSLAFRVGSAIHAYWGLGYFFVSLIFIKLMVSPVQRNFNKSHHKFSYFDKVVTEGVFNIIILAVIVNGVLHILVEEDLKNVQIVFWGFGQFQMILQEYYYFLAMIPPFLLSFKLKSTKHVGWLRIILLLLIGLKDNYWLIIDNSHWALIALRLKEEILFVLFFIVKLIYGNNRVDMIEDPKAKEIHVEKSNKTEEKVQSSAKRQQEVEGSQSSEDDRSKQQLRERQKTD